MTDPLARIDLGGARKVSRKDMAVRFGFGAGISILAGLAGSAWGPAAGGLLLAFPAILPATLTLIEKKEGEKHARDDDSGAILGAIALIGFAVLGWQLITNHGAFVALAAATGCWLASAVVLYLVSRLITRRSG